MADFNISYKKTSINEGGYANDKDDHGGETWRGIARNMHPDWEGWARIDRHKKENGFPGTLKNDLSLQDMVDSFYQMNFWNKIKGSEIQSQQIADSLYDSAVNMSPIPAIRLLQDAVFALPTDPGAKAAKAKELDIIYGYMDEKTLDTINNKT